MTDKFIGWGLSKGGPFRFSELAVVTEAADWAALFFFADYPEVNTEAGET